ncbi:MAG: hypothetical protein AAEJ47_01695, partial [Planctomycetota bacterium]
MKSGSLVRKFLFGILLLGILSWSFPIEDAVALSVVQDPTPVTGTDDEAKQDPPSVDDILGADDLGIPASEPAALEVIDRYIEAVGGKQTMGSIADRVERFRNKKIDPTKETVMKMSRFLKRTGEGVLMIREEWQLP